MVKTHLSSYHTQEAREPGHLYTGSHLSEDRRGTLTSQPICGQSRRPGKALTQAGDTDACGWKLGKKKKRMIRAKADT